MKFEKKQFSEEEISSKFISNYLNQEKKYLECIYFQILRNSHNEEFTEFNLFNFLSFSDYLQRRFFKIMSKNTDNKSNSISLDDFTGCIANIFSQFSSEEDEIKLFNIIFNLISDSEKTITFSELRDFLNHLIFEAFCKAKLTEYDLFIYTCLSVKKYFKKYFFLNCNNFNKCSKISDEIFFKILEKNPNMKNLIVFLFNVISPINEKLLLKICKKGYTFHLNDDFEIECELNQSLDMTPRINSFSNYKEKDVFENKKSALFKEKTSSNGFDAFIKPNINFDKYFIKNDQNDQIESSIKKEEMCFTTDTSPDSISESNPEKQRVKYSNDDLKSVIKSLRNEQLHVDDVDYQQKHYQNIIKNSNEFYNVKFDIGFNESNKTEFCKEKKQNENKIRFFNDSYCKINKTIDNFSKDTKNEIKNYDYYRSIESKKNNNNNSKYIKRDFNIISNIDDNKPLEILLYLHMKIKEQKSFLNISHKFKVLFIKEDYFVDKNVELEFNAQQKESKINHFNKYENIIKNGFSLRIKFIGDEIILYKVKKSKNNFNKINESSDYFYFYKLNEAIFDPLSIKENCKIELNSLEKQKIYYLYGFSIYGGRYKIFFEDYEELILFYKITKKKSFQFNNTYSQIYKNKSNLYHFIQNSIHFENYKRKFSYILEIFNELSNTNTKIQLFNKEYLQKEENKFFLINIFSLCRLNNFFNINIFPIAKIYENNSFYIIEYSSDEFVLEYDDSHECFIVTIKNLKLSEFFKNEVSKFKNIVRILNIKTKVIELFQLLNLQKKLIFP